MPMGPGKYDALCSEVRVGSKAAAVLLMVIAGDKGSGFSVQTADPELLAALPAILRDVAKQIEDAGGQA